jgi:hypothetical protein
MVSLCEGLARAGRDARPGRRDPGTRLQRARRIDLLAQLPHVARRPRQRGADIGQGAFQVMALVRPYLVGEARAHLDRLGQNYID